MWMRQLLGKFGMRISGTSELRVDNQSTILVTCNPEHHGRMKHLNLCYYWLRNVVETGTQSCQCSSQHTRRSPTSSPRPCRAPISSAFVACSACQRNLRPAPDLGGVLRFGSGAYMVRALVCARCMPRCFCFLASFCFPASFAWSLVFPCFSPLPIAPDDDRPSLLLCIAS